MASSTPGAVNTETCVRSPYRRDHAFSTRSRAGEGSDRVPQSILQSDVRKPRGDGRVNECGSGVKGDDDDDDSDDEFLRQCGQRPMQIFIELHKEENPRGDKKPLHPAMEILLFSSLFSLVPQ